MTKIDLVNILYDRLGLSKKECAGIVDAFFERVKETLAKGEDVNISSFGKFIIKQKQARKGRNPQTGEGLEIVGRKVLHFRTSDVMKDMINKT